MIDGYKKSPSWSEEQTTPEETDQEENTQTDRIIADISASRADIVNNAWALMGLYQMAREAPNEQRREIEEEIQILRLLQASIRNPVALRPPILEAELPAYGFNGYFPGQHRVPLKAILIIEPTPDATVHPITGAQPLAVLPEVPLRKSA